MLPIVAIFAGLLWTCARATPSGEHTCTGVVKHPVTVLVNVTEPVTYRSYTWCLRVPPRCSKYTVLLKDRIKVHTEMHNRTITVCCPGYVEVEYKCVPACPQEVTCPFMHCNRTNHCYCSPGYTGLYCSQPCQRGVWGKDCKKLCDCPADYTCHHLTGDCFEDETLKRTTKAPKTTTKTPKLTTTTTERTLPTIQELITMATTLETVKTPVFKIPPPPYVPPTKRRPTTTSTTTQLPVTIGTSSTPMATTSTEIEKVIEGIFLTSPLTTAETTVSPIENYTPAVTSEMAEVQTSPAILNKTIKTSTFIFDDIKLTSSNDNIQLTKELMPVTTTESPSKTEKTTKLYYASEISTVPKLLATTIEINSDSDTVPSNVFETKKISKHEHISPRVTKPFVSKFQTTSTQFSEALTSPYQSSTKLYTETKMTETTKPATIGTPKEKTIINRTNAIIETEVYKIPEITTKLETSAAPIEMSTPLISENKATSDIFNPPEIASTEISERETIFDGKFKEINTIGTTENIPNTKLNLASTPNIFSNENFISTTIQSTTVFSKSTENREVSDPFITNTPVSTTQQTFTKIDILPPTLYTSVEKVRKKQYDKPKQSNKVNPFKELSENVTLSKRSTDNPTLETAEITTNYEIETKQTSDNIPSTDSTSTTKNNYLMKTVSLEETTITHLTQHKDYKQNIQHLAEKSLKETFSAPKIEVPPLKENSATEDGTIIESNTISSFLHTYGENTDFKHFPSGQEDNSYSVESNKIKFNISKTVAAGVTSSKEGNLLNTITTMSLMLGLGLTTLMFLSTTIWIYFKRKNKRLIYKSQHMVCPSPDPLIYDLGSVDVAGMEQTTFFCPTFTNNYAERINRELNELDYDHPRSSFSEPLYAEIRY